MTKREPTKEDFVLAAMAERKDMLILAQQKLDEIHRFNIGLSGGRPGSSSSRNRRRSAMSNHLLSSLLYVALMSYKIEDMKALLREEDNETFIEWEVLLNSLHSPEFHAKERVVQNKRVKTAFERKRQYKDVSTGLQQELTDTTDKLSELQKISNETSQQMSRTINVLQDERSELLSKVEKKQNEFDELKQDLSGVKSQLDKAQADEKRKDETIARQNRQLEANEAAITGLEDRISQLLKEQAVADEKANSQKQAISDLSSRLDKSESDYVSYRSEKEALISELQQDLKESEARYAAVKAQLESSNAVLEDSKKALDTNRASIESKLDTLGSDSVTCFAEVKSLLSNMESTLSRTESLVKRANELQTESNNHTSAWIEKSQVFDKALEGNAKLHESVVKLSSQSEQIGQSFSSVQQDVAAANMSLVKLERISDRIKDSLSDVQISLSAASTNDVIVSRLENRSVHIEDMLASVQRELSEAMMERNGSSLENKADASLSRLQVQIKQIHGALVALQESINVRIDESASNEEKSRVGAADVFSKLEDKADEILTCVKELGAPKSDEASVQALTRIENTTRQTSNAVSGVRELLANVIASIPRSPADDEDGTGKPLLARPSSFREDIKMGEPPALAANDLVDSCVSEAISAVSPSKIPVI